MDDLSGGREPTSGPGRRVDRHRLGVHERLGARARRHHRARAVVVELPASGNLDHFQVGLERNATADRDGERLADCPLE
jgi:hypothetical protein